MTMADNISVKDSGGTARTLRTTESAGVHTPRHHVESIAAGENHVGEVGGRVVRLTPVAQPVVSASPDYSAGDAIGSAALDFTAAVRVAAGNGFIRSVTIRSKVDITAQIDVVFFNAVPAATITDNGAVAFGTSDLTKMIGFAKVTDWVNLGTIAVGYKECNVPIKLASGTDIYAVLVARGAINLASTSDIDVEIAVDQN